MPGMTPEMALVLGLALGSVRIDDRPDLRQAADAVAELGGQVPVVAVFASEAAWYIRTPAPIPSRREPDGIRQRMVEVLGAQRSACLAAISLPGTFPDEASLQPGPRTLAVAEVTGLDVRLVGSAECAIPNSALGWARPPR